MKEKIKNINIKNMIKVFTLVWGLALIVVMTITNVGIKEEFDFFQWLSNSLILLGIMVFGLLLGESIGKDKQVEKVGGLYQRNLLEYNTFRKLVDPIIVFFSQYYQWFMPKELRDKKINFLIMNGVEMKKAEYIVDYCTIDDFFELQQHPIEREGIIIRKLTSIEIEPVEDVLSGKIKLDLSNPSYYLSAFGLSNSKSVLEIGKQLDKEIKFNRKSNRIIKISVSLIVSLLLGILTVKEFMEGGDSQAWLNLISRVTALFTSLLSGWLSAVVDVKLRAEKLSNKTTILKMFKNAIDMKIFIPKSESELAKEELSNYLKEEEDKLKNVITPEITDVPQIENCETKLLK